jgi:hypothetical protein
MSRCRWASHMVLILRSAHPGFLTPRGVNSCALAPRVSVRWADEQPRVLSGCRDETMAMYSSRPDAGGITLAWVMTSQDGPAGWSRGSDGSGLGDRNDIGSLGAGHSSTPRNPIDTPRTMSSCIYRARRFDRTCLPPEAGLWLAWTAPKPRPPRCGGRRGRDGCGMPTCISSSSMTAPGPSARRIRAFQVRHGRMKTMPPEGRGLLWWKRKRAEPCRPVACHLNWSTVRQPGR